MLANKPAQRSLATGLRSNWRPGAALDILAARAKMLAAVRDFFAARGVLEVETPLVSSAAATDPNIESLRVLDPAGAHRYLNTSPEFAMKRLLAAGSGDIYQVSRAFRAGECGALHNPEFTLLEWYREGFDLQGLMWEVAELIASLVQDSGLVAEAAYHTYRELFLETLGCDPLATSVSDLGERLKKAGIAPPAGECGLDELLDLALTTVVLPALASDRLIFIYDYPISQAALARSHPGDARIARRFEAVYGGIELANGFEELADPDEQGRRFQNDLELRARRGLAAVEQDERLLGALASGLPSCAGVALGLDRVLMLACGLQHIDEVLSFSWERA